VTQLNTSYCKGNSAAWVGHVIRMTSNRLPRRILYGELVNGQRLPGGPNKLRYINHSRRILNKCNISTAELEQLSTDRDTWNSACSWPDSGLATLQCVCRSSMQLIELKTDVPAGTIQPTHQLLVRNAHSAAESALPSRKRRFGCTVGISDQ